ncbi:MAG: phosphotransferase [Planctomycetia bacterium]|nr:phosphotransferase [Planctomycetia bacterium]
MTDALAYQAVLQSYSADCQPSEVEFLGAAGGFSGARFWRLASPRGRLCLRRWPRDHPLPERLEFIQAVLWHVDQEGFHKVPVPLETLRHAGYVRYGGHLWELSPWLPGEPDVSKSPPIPRLRAAMIALAEFHEAASSFPLAEIARSSSPTIGERLAQLRALRSAGHDRLRHAVEHAPGPHDAAAQRLLDLFPIAAPRVQVMLEQAARLPVTLAPCLRDVWRGNVLFVGGEVTGLIDFGALRPESAAADVARLLGSMAEDDRGLWKEGLAAYERARPLTEATTVLVAAFDVSGVLLGGMNWIEWIYRDQRSFDDAAAVQARLDYFGRRLAHLIETG